MFWVFRWAKSNSQCVHSVYTYLMIMTAAAGGKGRIDAGSIPVRWYGPAQPKLRLVRDTHTHTHFLGGTFRLFHQHHTKLIISTSLEPLLDNSKTIRYKGSISKKQTNPRIKNGRSYWQQSNERGMLFSVCRQSHDGRTQSNEKKKRKYTKIGEFKRESSSVAAAGRARTV